MFKQFFEVFWPKAKEYVAEQGFNKALNIKDFEDTLENLQNNLKLLSAKAIDVETEIKNAEDSGRKKRKREAEVWLEGVESIKVKVEELGREAESRGFMMRFLDGGKAAQLNGDIDKLVQQRLHIGEPVLDACGSRGETLLTNEMAGEAFNQNFETILEVLENGQVSRIGVYGMGGVGKTTLAKHIYNRVVQDYEGRVVWVTVSHEFTIKSLQEKIAQFMGVELKEKAEEAFRASRLRSFLSDKKISVIILDDVWENIDMREVGCDLEGCRLIITTRSVGVCHQIGCQKEIPVGKLHEGEAWKLFNERLGNEKLDPEVEGFAKSMVKLCGGLPLAIITVARTMRGKRGSHRWRNDFLELKERVKGHDGRGEDVVFEVLKFSFDRLKEKNDTNNEFNRFQLCFLYCSLYPEDYHIKRDELVGKFISEGLLGESRSRRARFDQGHSILDELVDVCLLESCISDYNGEECVKMHDLVRGMALMICKGKYMVRAGERSLKEILDEEEWTKDLEKVSLMQCSIERIGEGFSPDCPKLSTLLLLRNTELKGIPESLFSKMEGLCTLDFRGSFKITMLPNSVSDLTSLKSLLLEGCSKLEKVPYLGKMKALRELNLSYTAIKEAPQGLEELVNLRFLSIYAPGLKMLPRGVLLKLVNLEHLNIPLGTQVSTEEIENLNQLEEFSGGVTSVSDFNKFVRSRAHDPGYRIRVSKRVVESDIWEILYKEEWSKAPIDNELELHGCNLKDEKVLGKGAVELTIIECKGMSKWLVDDLWERFDNPTSLKRLMISECRGIEWIMRSEDGQGLSSNLKEIDLFELDDLKGVMERERGGIGIGIVAAAAAAQPPVFSSLKKLVIVKCNMMRKLGLPVSALPNLEQIIISMCGEVEEIFEEEDEDEDEGIAADSIVTLPKLRELTLVKLPRLKRVSKATIISNSIWRIFIRKCPELKNRLPLDFDDQAAPPPSLKYLWVERGWWESLEWDNPLLPQLLHPFLRFDDDSEEFEDDSEEE